MVDGVIKCDPLQFQHIAKLRENRFESVSAKAFTAEMSEFVKMLNAGQPQPDAGPNVELLA